MTDDPLSEASPKSLDELFNSDPFGLNDRDIDRVVAALREHRARIAAAGGDVRKAAKAAPKVQAKPGSIKLGDLFSEDEE